MKVLFKYVLTLLVFLVSVTAGQNDQLSRNFDRHIAGVRRQNLNNINNMRFRDGDTYGATGRTVPNIKEILQSQERNETIPLVQDRSIWAPSYWNFDLFIRFVDGVATGQLSCDERGLDALRATLCREAQYSTFSSKVNNAIEDDKKHCANLDLYGFMRSNFQQGQRPTPASQPAPVPPVLPVPAHWQSQTIVPAQHHYVLRDQRYQCDEQRYAQSEFYYCPEVLVHPYSGTILPPMDHFNARIPMDTGHLRQNIIANLPQARLEQELIITVQNPVLNDDAGEQLFRPQHAFFHYYHGANIQSNVDCWVKWWDTTGASSTLSFPSSSTMPPVSIHPGAPIPGTIDQRPV
ncbi:MAG: hypothetical protein LBU35_01430, partial [Holosporales bacterium]|nr:hypothetical protein [Holosporales bacterium]